MFGKNVSDLAHWLDTVYMESQELLQDQYQDIMARDEFKHMFAVVNEVIGQVGAVIFIYFFTTEFASKAVPTVAVSKANS